jgi:hypothetical protein
MQTSIESIDKDEKKIKIKISFDYKIYNGKKVLVGVSNHLLSVIEKEGEVLVSSVELWKEK